MNIPKGWKLVPVEPTPEMVAAVLATAHDNYGRDDPMNCLGWAESKSYVLAAIDAAPTPPVQGTVTMRYDLYAAASERAIRIKLIELGWTPPGEQQDDDALEVLRELIEARDDLVNAETVEQLYAGSRRWRSAASAARALIAKRGAA